MRRSPLLLVGLGLFLGTGAEPTFAQERPDWLERYAVAPPAADSLLSARGTLRWSALAGDRRFRFPGQALSLAVSPDGRRIAAALGSSVMIWDAGTGLAVEVLDRRRLSLTGGEVLGAVAFQRDGSLLTGTEGTVVIWDPPTSGPLRSSGAGRERIRALAGFPDGRRVACGTQSGGLEVRDLVTGERIGPRAAHQDEVTAIAVDREGRWILSTGEDGTVQVWSPDLRERFHCYPPNGEGDHAKTAIDASASRFVTSGRDRRSVALWDVETWSERLSFRTGRGLGARATLVGDSLVTIAYDGSASIRALAAEAADVPLPGLELPKSPDPRGSRPRLASSADGRLLAIAEGGRIRVRDVATGTEWAGASGGGPISAVASAPGTDWFAAAAGREIRIHDAASGALRRRLEGHEGIVRSLAVGPEGRWLASAGEDDTLRIWDPASGQELRRVDRPCSALAVGPGGAWILSGLALVDPETGEEIRRFDGLGWSGVAASPDGRWIAGRCDGLMRFWDAASGAVLSTMSPLGSGWLVAVVPSAGGRYAISIDIGGTIALVDPATGAIVRRRMGAGRTWNLALDPRGERLAVLGHDRLTIWDMETLDLLDVIPFDGECRAVAFCGDRILAGSEDSTVRVYEPATASLAAREGEVEALLQEGDVLQEEYLVDSRIAADLGRESKEIYREIAAAQAGSEDLDRLRALEMEAVGRQGQVLEAAAGVLARALWVYERALALDPQRGEAWGGRAWRRFAAGDVEGGGRDLERAFSLAPDAVRNVGLRAYHRWQTGDWDGCLADLDRCGAAGHRVEWARETRARILLASGSFDEAARLFEELAEAGAPWLAAQAELSRSLSEEWRAENSLRAAEAARDDLPRVRLATEKGEIVLELFEDQAPLAVANFLRLVEDGEYDGTRFHFVVPFRSVYGGDPNTRSEDPSDDGFGRSAFRIWSEAGEGSRHSFPGTISTVGGWPTADGRYFQIALAAIPELDGRETVFGRVVEGMDAARHLEQGTRLVSATVLRKRDHPYEPRRLR